MQFRSAGLDLTFRTILAAALAFGLTTLTVFASHAGPTPTPTATATPTPSPHCDMGVSLDKKCSVGGSIGQDSCVATEGEEVTYIYGVEISGGWGLGEVWDDKLGLIGQSSGETLYRTTTLTETTTNWATLTVTEHDPTCFCIDCDDFDEVTVTIWGPTPTPIATATPTATPTPTPMTCAATWPETAIVTVAKGQSAANNEKVSHLIVGNIIDPSSICPSEGACTAHRIPVCAGTGVSIAVSDTTGGATNTNIGKGDIVCDAAGCSVGAVNVTEKYKSVSFDGKDTDRVTLLPK